MIVRFNLIVFLTTLVITSAIFGSEDNKVEKDIGFVISNKTNQTLGIPSNVFFKTIEIKSNSEKNRGMWGGINFDSCTKSEIKPYDKVECQSKIRVPEYFLTSQGNYKLKVYGSFFSKSKPDNYSSFSLESNLIDQTKFNIVLDSIKVSDNTLLEKFLKEK